MLDGMAVALAPISGPSQVGPWFRRHPSLALVVAGVLFTGVLTLRLTAGNATDAYSMLYALPVALLASAFGFRAGAFAGLAAVGLIVLWAAARHITLTPTGWTSRVVPLLLLGVLVGQAADQARRAEAERRRLETSALLHREAIEINDMLVQGLAAARLYFEGGDVAMGRRILDETIGQARELVSGLIRRADMGGRTEQVGRHGSGESPGSG